MSEVLSTAAVGVRQALRCCQSIVHGVAFVTAAVLQLRESCDTPGEKPYHSDILATPQMLELPMGSMLAGYMLVASAISVRNLCIEAVPGGSVRNLTRK